MTNSLQDLIDASIFISTEYQARLAELVGTSDWDVDFTAQSLDFSSTPPVKLAPYLLGTESENRGTWIWSWQQLGYFPDAVVSAALQTRAGGTERSLVELTTDELPISEGLGRRLTLAAKTLTGLYAHYPLPAGAGVRAWSLVEGEQLVLPEPTMQQVGRVIARTLQSEEIANQHLAVDSYAKQRGFHIAWDTEATAVLTFSDGALRLWFDEGRISGIEQAEPQTDAAGLAAAAQAAQSHRAELAAARLVIERAAAQEAEQQNAQREAEAAARAAERAAAAQEAERAAAAAARAEEEAASIAGVTSTENVHSDAAAPFDQDPREDVQPGRVTVETLPDSYVEVEEISELPEGVEPIETVEVEAAEVETEQAETVEVEIVEEYAAESVEEETVEVADEVEEPAAPAQPAPAPAQQAQPQPKPAEGKKKGFFSRFFGL